MFTRLKFILDRKFTVANALEKSIAAYGEDFEVLRFSGSLERLGVAGQALTVGQLKRLCDRISRTLVELGLKRYDRVAIYQHGSVEYLIYSLAIMRAGAITVPINGSMRAQDLQAYLDYTGSRFVFVDAERLARLSEAALAQGRLTAIVTDVDSLPAAAGVVALATGMAQTAGSFRAVDLPVHDDVMIVHTSGTTGFPKGVLHGSYSIARATRGQLLIQPITRNNRILLASPANHHITQAGIFSCLAAGVPGYVPAGESPEALLGIIERERCSLVLAFPDVYQGMCQAGLERYNLRHVKAWMAGGDSSHEVHIRQLTAHGAMVSLFGKRLLGSMYLEFFGTSEVGFAALIKASFSFTRRFQRYVGRPSIVSPKVKIADEHGRPLPAGMPGRLMVKGPTLFKGYWNAHDRLHGVSIDGWWWTGDVAVRTPSGGFYHLDREVDAIRSGDGYVYSLQLEEKILAHPAIADVAVVELPDAARRVSAVVQCHDGQPLDAPTFRAWLQQQLPEHSGLRIEILAPGEQLPRGLTGKVLKQRLRERYCHPVASP